LTRSIAPRSWNIGKKIIKILNSSDDLDLLTFARENLGAGVTVKRHQGMLKDVQFSILLRKGAVQRHLASAGAGGGTGLKAASSMSLAELLKAADTKKGAQLNLILTEIEKRQGAKVVDALAQAAGSPDKDLKFLGAGLLAKHISRQTSPQLQSLLKHDRPEVKAAAAKEIGARGKSTYALLDLLDDSDPTVHQAARAALVQHSRGTVDYGPDPEASIGERQTAQRRWRDWLEKSR
jgi:HEAT repeat protein